MAANKYLIVDDDDAVRDLLSLLFEGDAEITCAANGLEALELTKTYKFDMVFSDINMPIMDGVEFCERAMEGNSEFSAHLVILTGNPSKRVLSLCQENHIPLFSKPVSVFELKEAVNLMLKENESHERGQRESYAFNC